MGKLKYIMFENGEWVVFPDFMTHADKARDNGRAGNPPISAGFITLHYGTKTEGTGDNAYTYEDFHVTTWGKSDSLKLESRPEDGRAMSRLFSTY